MDPLLEQILTPEPLLDFSHFPESIVVHALPDSRSIIPSFLIQFWDIGVDNNDSEINLKIWKLDGVKFLIKIIHIYIILVGYIREISGGFLRTPRKVEWAAFRGPIRPSPKPPPWGDFFPSLSICFMHIYIHNALKTMHEISVGDGLLT